MLLSAAALVLALVVRSGAAEEGSLTVLVVCNTDPETTAVLNTTGDVVIVNSIASLHDPASGEPFVLERPLAPGESVMYFSGTAPPPLTLADHLIYQEEVSDEGAQVVTSIGTLNALCGSGSASLQPGAASTPVATASPTAAPATPTPEAPPQGVVTPPSTGSAGLR